MNIAQCVEQPQLIIILSKEVSDLCCDFIGAVPLNTLYTPLVPVLNRQQLQCFGDTGGNEVP